MHKRRTDWWCVLLLRVCSGSRHNSTYVHSFRNIWTFISFPCIWRKKYVKLPILGQQEFQRSFISKILIPVFGAEFSVEIKNILRLCCRYRIILMLHCQGFLISGVGSFSQVAKVELFLIRRNFGHEKWTNIKSKTTQH